MGRRGRKVVSSAHQSGYAVVITRRLPPTLSDQVYADAVGFAPYPGVSEESNGNLRFIGGLDWVGGIEKGGS